MLKHPVDGEDGWRKNIVSDEILVKPIETQGEYRAALDEASPMFNHPDPNEALKFPLEQQPAARPLIKSFGPVGPKYEVGIPLRQLDDGDWIIEITMVETSEKAEYRLSHLLKDPEAQ